jgi:hypothetical protein
MDLTSYEKIIQFASDLLNSVRGFLSTQLNIELPMWMAQGIVLALFLPIMAMLVRKALNARASDGQADKGSSGGAARLAAWVGSIATGAVSLMIVLTWASYWRAPLLEQVQGEVTGAGPGIDLDVLQVALLDFRGESLGARAHWITGTNQFSLIYAPEFADPPTKIRIEGGGCQGERRPRPRELTRGMLMSISLKCGDRP